MNCGCTLMIAEIYLDFVDLLQDLSGIGFNICSYHSKVISVVDLMCWQIFFHVDDLHIYLGKPYLHMNPDRDYCNQKC